MTQMVSAERAAALRNKCLSLAQKRSGKADCCESAAKNVADLMDSLTRSIANDRGAAPAKGKKPRKAAVGQTEMLLPIDGKRAAKTCGCGGSISHTTIADTVDNHPPSVDKSKRA